MHWGYKASKKQLDRAGMIILGNRGVLCRSAYDFNGVLTDYAREVAVGDNIHVYFIGEPGKAPEVARYEVIPKEQHPNPETFGDMVPETCLHTVDEAFMRKTDSAGHTKPDPVLGTFTCWVVKKVGPARPFQQRMFPGQRVMTKLAELI